MVGFDREAKHQIKVELIRAGFTAFISAILTVIGFLLLWYVSVNSDLAYLKKGMADVQKKVGGMMPRAEVEHKLSEYNKQFNKLEDEVNLHSANLARLETAIDLGRLRNRYYGKGN